MFPAAVARVAHPAPAPHSRNPVMYSMILMSALATGPPAIPRTAPPAGEIGDRFFRPNLPAPAGMTARATVTVRLPADARLFAEGQPLTHAGGEKTFVTPELPPGRDFTYTFRAEYVRD